MILIAVIVALHTAAMVAFEGLSPGDALWLTLTSITTVGYGDLSAGSPMGRLATVILIYIGGIFVLGKVAGDFFDYRSLRREMMTQGKWDWSGPRDHIVLIGGADDNAHHLSRLIGEFERHEPTADREIVLVSESYPDGLPIVFDSMDIKHTHGPATDPGVLKRAGIASAGIVMVLSESDEDVRSDSRTFDLVHRIREETTEATLVAECVEDTNRQRLLDAGATLVTRPIRAYPEMLVGAMLQPGVNEILENLFTATGETIRAEEASIDGIWSDIVSDQVTRDRGIPIAYRDRETGNVVTAPPARAKIKARTLYLLRQ